MSGRSLGGWRLSRIIAHARYIFQRSDKVSRKFSAEGPLSRAYGGSIGFSTGIGVLRRFVGSRCQRLRTKLLG
jgi:hypothetical protein